MTRWGMALDLERCVGCYACSMACKTENGTPDGVWYAPVYEKEVGKYPNTKRMFIPTLCMHCEDAPCVPVCPTGASYKRAEDGIVLVNAEACIGCQLCAWACPYGARELDEDAGVMKKCTLCVDRIYNDNLDAADRVPACVSVCPTSARHYGDLADPASTASRLVAERGHVDMLPELGYHPVNRYLPPRSTSPRAPVAEAPPTLDSRDGIVHTANRLLSWMDRILSR